MKTKILIAVSFVLILSCTHTVKYTEQEIADYPQGVKELIRQGKIDFGMTPEQVRYSLGSPSDIRMLDVSPGNEGGDRIEWTYKRLHFYVTRLTFKKDKLVEIYSNDPEVKRSDR
ncbi:hypothetical protein [Candidatus Magnetomonas plexicatena]|uniref:hypothetical protein n=1 Tax=Candidatus Magnetomonas plexicatena TaxID=2552947 RepID=UPI0011046AAC|nr:outer membrane protein assembly factor BamE [Nitrospirales bacterium LBB_01]